MCVCVSMCMPVCMCVCMRVFTCGACMQVCLCVHISLLACCVWMHVHTCVCTLEKGRIQQRALSSLGEAFKFLCSPKCPALDVMGPGGEPCIS